MFNNKAKKSWRSALKKTERKWSINGMQLAFIKTESNFRPTARTQRKYVFGLIPQVEFLQHMDTSSTGWNLERI